MSAGRNAGLVGAALGVLAAGAAAGLLAERKLLGRSIQGRTLDGEPFGSRHSEPRIVTTDDGVELWVEVEQPRPGAAYGDLTVIFCHGYALNLDCWYFQRRGLGGAARLVFWDQRGHGRSGRGETGTHSIYRTGRDLAEVLEAVAPTGPVVLVGHSMGGMSVMAYADQHPEVFGDRIVGVALLSTSAGGMGEVTLGVPKPVARLAHTLAPRFVSVLARSPKAIERGRKSGSDLGFLLTRMYSFASPVPPSLVDFTAEMLASTPFEIVAEFFPSFDQHDLVDALPPLQKVESLVMVGDQDHLTPAEHSRDIARVVPGAELHVLDRCGHMIVLEYPDIVNERLRELLDRSLRLAQNVLSPADVRASAKSRRSRTIRGSRTEKSA